MWRPCLAALSGLFVVIISPFTAVAACTDPAAPEVNWRRCYHDGRSLVDVDLSGAMMRDATFQRANLDGSNLSGIDGFRAKFISASMVDVNLDGARLFEADLTRSDLTGASLIDADMRQAKLVNAVLREADLTGARMSGADLRNADLTGARWIDGERICGDASIGQCN